MEKDVKNLLVFRTRSDTRTGQEWRYVKSGDAYNNRLSVVADPLEAEQFGGKTPAQIASRVQALLQNNRNSNEFELVEITITTEIIKVDLDDGEILEERRRLALGKLTDSDIHVLGLGRLAAYDKLKFHGDE